AQDEIPALSVSRPQTKLQQELEFLEVQEEYIKDEQKIQSIPLVIGQFLEAVDQNILSTIDRELLKPNASVALHKENAPAIIFIDEIDAIATKILLELLNQMDGFDQNVNVKMNLSEEVDLEDYVARPDK
uniref:PA700 subunit P48=ATP-dependent 20 S proteasome activator (Fragments) n=1 Tax=Bos taurus TaxID=9913 RepID=Q9TS78_BOVIN